MTGCIVLDKPGGLTSFSAVARVRRLTGEKKAGHTGTLDPMATGVLPIMLGGATRFSSLLPSGDKGYRARIRLGTMTDTLDITGKVLAMQPVTADAAAFAAALKRFEGDIRQVPPMYSALSQNGVRLYELARRGVEVEREARTVTIYNATVIDADESAGEYTVDIRCSAGTYIRSLAADIGDALGCSAVLTALRRTMANGFTLADCVTLEQLETDTENGALPGQLIRVDEALKAYLSITVTAPQAVRFGNGGALDVRRVDLPAVAGLFRVYDPDGLFLGIGERLPDGDELLVKRVFTQI